MSNNTITIFTALAWYCFIIFVIWIRSPEAKTDCLLWISIAYFLLDIFFAIIAQFWGHPWDAVWKIFIGVICTNVCRAILLFLALFKIFIGDEKKQQETLLLAFAIAKACADLVHGIQEKLANNQRKLLNQLPPRFHPASPPLFVGQIHSASFHQHNISVGSAMFMVITKTSIELWSHGNGTEIYPVQFGYRNDEQINIAHPGGLLPINAATYEDISLESATRTIHIDEYNPLRRVRDPHHFTVRFVWQSEYDQAIDILSTFTNFQISEGTSWASLTRRLPAVWHTMRLRRDLPNAVPVAMTICILLIAIFLVSGHPSPNTGVKQDPVYCQGADNGWWNNPNYFNNFVSQDHCEKFCSRLQYVCKLPREQGNRGTYSNRWWFNAKTGICEEFMSIRENMAIDTDKLINK